MPTNGFRISFLLILALAAIAQPAQAMELDEVFSPVSTWLDDHEPLECDLATIACPLADDALTFHGSIAQYYLGVVGGGASREWEYAGTGNYSLNVDFGKLGVQNGLTLDVLAVNRWGNPLGRQQTGSILPPALDTFIPPTYDLVLLDVIFTQVLNDNLSVFAGKIDTLSGDENPFASGRGRTGFMNTSLLIPINGVPMLPVSTLGAGVNLMADGQPFGKIMVLNGTDNISTSGFNELFDQGASFIAAAGVPVPLFGKFGIQSVMAAYNTRTFTALGQDPRVILPNVPTRPTTGSWLFSWGCAYYFEQFDPEHNPMQGWGLFARLGASDPEVNPISHWVNLGLGGNSPIHGRENDRFGIGWYYNALSSDLGPIAQAALQTRSYTTGMEIFYNYAVNEHLFITPDLQIIQPGRAGSSTTTVAGIRVEVTL